MAMKSADIREIVRTLLDATCDTVGEDGLLDSLALIDPRQNQFTRGLEVTVFFRRKKLIPAAIKLRTLGPAHLRYLSLTTSFDLLRQFLRNHYHLLGGNLYFPVAGASLLEQLSPEKVQLLVDRFAESDILNPAPETCLFPLTIVRMDTSFDGNNFAMCTGADLTSRPMVPQRFVPHLAGEVFPPFRDRAFSTRPTASWLLVKAPSLDVGKKYRSSILGAVALTMIHRYRHQFTGREVWGGAATLGSGWKYSDGPSHTPAISSDIVLTAEDAVWLTMLDEAISSRSASHVRKLKALQYFYRSWFFADSERFAIHCITIDAIFGDDTGETGATDAVVRGVDTLFEGRLDRDRVRLLMKLRNSVLHGGAPDIYDSKKYAKYYREYGEDPVREMSALVAECLRRAVFDGKLREQPDPFTQVINDAVSKGIMTPFKPEPILAPIAP
ncbi:hypothetical protein GN330_13810 [Nitratireductor sp. CAU 1489]|uniref:Apea-like HEPN domain-containing protein n=1 Tax=Nitratireductor arenosus TaxID=2682096 RepID=A0A844QK43_9HYPH|nr:hypothetical protein [Nitratireductor arenosus]MVA98320.1 hypothetical protein [Nitratireductor arenosus]